MAHIDTLFKTMLEQGASDLHLVAGQKPTLRIHGELERLESHGVLDHDALHAMLYEITPSNKKADFDQTGDARNRLHVADVRLDARNVARSRRSASRDRPRDR